ncbi:MAG: hypothetical protein ABI954_11790 [Pyrinomonadaceae bacterium]
MFFAFILLLLITASGIAVTYFYDRDLPFFGRVCAGIVLGQVLFALVGLAFGCLIGMSPNIAVLSALVTALPLLALTQKQIKNSAQADFFVFLESIKNFVLHPVLGRAIAVAIYIWLIVLLWMFFERAMLNTAGGIGTGSPHNTGDISFHLQAIYGFLNGQNFPPQNPSYAGAKFTYPFMVDLVAAMLTIVGAKISQAMFWQNMLLVIALIGLMHRFTFKLTNNKFAAQIAPLILLFSGGFGFLLFFSSALESSSDFFDLLMKMPDNYTIRSESSWRWGNSLTVLFMTQRSILLGLPLALIILTKVWEIFSNSKLKIQDSKLSENITEKRTISIFNFPFLILNYQTIIVGLLAGTLPLVHAHSFAVVMGMTGCLALMSWRKWREWASFFIAAAVVSVPELLWAMKNSASKIGNFFNWQFGWDSFNTNFVLFWLKNTGFFIPLLIAAIIFLIVKSLKLKSQTSNEESLEDQLPASNHLKLLLFWLPFALCFIVPNVARLAPWIWDNIKVLIYWFTVSIPLVALLIAQIWQEGKSGKILTVALLIGLTLSGWLDVWRIASKQMEYQVFSRDAVLLAGQARQKLAPDAIVMSAPVFYSPAALMGRRWFLGFTAHLWTHGIDAVPRENQLREIYRGGANSERLLLENNIGYIVVSPQEYEYTVVNDNFLNRFPIVAQAGEYRLLQVK